ncbi:protein mono-ADP-ribosyltransferase PARP12 isoform X8 [Carassius gibelio]|uniref:protein mono-ADP-ribosyltransferase PARP12 isoform X7 n=1 Tax=Carassius gibelio TaxID=101364 RepID=UPI002278F429|nr:protein mono-ADP-ribosyltransferase PARP12 isoform X7 [Carassius gibelio]XP_052411037.1 protein mono-ADP-ribosyltransferase PARP12 isoform X8 [Carassius gibelio]
MAEEMILKVLCGNHGSMEYERLLEISYGLKEISADNSLDKILQRRDIFTVIQRSESKEVFAQTTVKLCRRSECVELCGDLHLCKYELMMGRCSRHSCSYGHQLMSEHNVRILRAHGMIRLSRQDLCVMFLQSDSGLLPPVCTAYNRRGSCPDGEKCSRLHVCESFVRGRCADTDCGRSHDFHEPHVRKVLRSRGVSQQLMSSLPFIYRNILTLKTLKTLKTQPDHRNTDVQPHRSSDAETEICLSFVRGFCGADKCSKTHCKMPYKWEVKVGGLWHDLPNSEPIERDYSQPSNIHSSGNEPVCFEEMTLGLDEVRRLSTQSSVLLPGFALTTRWSWFWKDEYKRWIQYGSIAEMHRLSSVSSEQLELRYQEYLRQEQEDAGIKFSAGNRFYELRFTDMKQRNEVSGTERPVRRRPVFVSSLDVQIARARCCGSIKTCFSKGVPGFWDQNAVPDFGFQRVRLLPSHRDYVRVHERFTQTLKGFTVRRIERVQNRELWEDFMIKKERMKVTNKQEKFGDRLLFHATESSLVEDACLRNIDFETSDSAPYGRGIYFSKDSRYWMERADGSDVRLMFACRVLVGFYTRGAAHLRHPPARNTDGRLYDSCVDNPRDPAVFVVFDRCQIYPEFLISFEDSNKCFLPEIARVHTNEEQSSISSLEAPEHTSSSDRTTEPLITLSRSTLDTHVGTNTALPVSDELISTALPVCAKSDSNALPVSAECISIALPVSSGSASNALPVSSESVLNAHPVLTKRISTAFPVSPEDFSNAFPLSAKSISSALPVSGKCISTEHPVSIKSASNALPVSNKSASNALPVSSGSVSNALPVSSGSASNALPVSNKSASNALPVSSGSASNALPVSNKSVSNALPVSSGSASNALPVSNKSVSNALLVSSGSVSNALPVSNKSVSNALPVSSGSASNALPVSNKSVSNALLVSSGSVSNALPVSSGSVSNALPVSSGSASNALPVSNKSASNALPVSSGSVSNALPVSSESVLNAHPVLTKRISTAFPVSPEEISNAFPLSAKGKSLALPVSGKCISTAHPVSIKSASNALPVSSVSASNTLPVSSVSASRALPVSSVSASRALPVSSVSASRALPVSSVSASRALPVSSVSASRALPVSSVSASRALPVSSGCSPVSLSSSVSSSHQRSGNSSEAAHSRKPAAQKNSCSVM